MTYRKLLGLENTKISDEELMQTITNAYLRHKSIIEIPTNGTKVVINLHGGVEEAGLMKGQEPYYAQVV